MSYIINLEILTKENKHQVGLKTFSKQKVYLIFCIGAQVVFQFGPIYSRPLPAGQAFIIFDPDKDIEHNLQLQEESIVCILESDLSTLHGFFVPDSEIAPIFNPELAQKKFYEQREIPIEIIPILHQLAYYKATDASQKLFLHAKSLEILSLFFNLNKPNYAACPFLNNDEVVRKIKQAKDILLENYNKTITLTEVARITGLNEYQLKLGFKELYGNTPYQYVLDFKLDIAKQMLTKKQLQVAEIADKIGYTNISHFIAAFKRKFGTTPKQYILKQS